MWIESLILGFFTFLQIVNGGEDPTTTEYTKDYSINSINEERHTYSGRVSYLILYHYYLLSTIISALCFVRFRFLKKFRNYIFLKNAQKIKEKEKAFNRSNLRLS